MEMPGFGTTCSTEQQWHSKLLQLLVMAGAPELSNLEESQMVDLCTALVTISKVVVGPTASYLRYRSCKQKLAGNPPGTCNSKKCLRDDDKYTKDDTTKLANNISKAQNNKPCPVHKNSNHTWWECYNNRFGKHKDAPLNKGPGKKPNDGKGNGRSLNQYMCQEIVDSDATTDIEELENAMNSDQEENQDDELDYPLGSCLDALITACDDVFTTGNSPEEKINYSSNTLVFPSSGTQESVIGMNVEPQQLSSLELKPIGLLLAKSMQGYELTKPLKVLFDSWSDKTFINRRVLPSGVNGKTVQTKTFSTLMGAQKMNQEVVLNDITLPEFSPTKRIDHPCKALIWDAPKSPYDVYSRSRLHGTSGHRHSVYYENSGLARSQESVETTQLLHFG
eukprot:Nitzschia sp. Nitz4//scaffold155_size52807//35946//37208//NITZ4_006802-RA/size52807-snap-gene-0.39-mRNA-1//1//CDS//3329537387//6672//frame0